MLLDDLKSKLSSSINPKLETEGNYRLASVLVVIYGDEPIVVMTEKPKHMKFHGFEKLSKLRVFLYFHEIIIAS